MSQTVQPQYTPYWNEIQNVGSRMRAILSNTNPSFTKEMKLEKIANANRYFQRVVTSLEQFVATEGGQFKEDQSEIDSPLPTSTFKAEDKTRK
jgi:hypothetical protein